MHSKRPTTDRRRAPLAYRLLRVVKLLLTTLAAFVTVATGLGWL